MGVPLLVEMVLATCLPQATQTLQATLGPCLREFITTNPKGTEVKQSKNPTGEAHW